MTTVLKSKEGRLYEVEDNEAKTLQRNLGWTPASPEEVSKRMAEREDYSKYGSTGQQAKGLAEAAIRSGTFSAVKGFGDEEDIKGRARVVEQQSPVLNAAAQAVPGIAAATGAAIATGGASLPVTLAAQGAVGGLSNLGVATDEAWRHDRELSAEEGWSSFGTGVLLGAGAELGVTGIARGVGAARNKLVEASGRLARSQEGRAFARAGIDNAVSGLGKAAEDEAVAATIRGAAQEVRQQVKKDLADVVSKMNQAQEAHSAFRNSTSEAIGDVFQQRQAVREVAEAVGREDPGLGRRIMDNLDAAQTSDEVYSAARYAQSAIDDSISRAASKEAVEKLRGFSKSAQSVTENSSLFGRVADDVATHNSKVQQVLDARAQLDESLGKVDYTSVVGTTAGKEARDSLENYAAKLEDLIQSTKDNPLDPLGAEATKGLEAVKAFRDLSEGNLQKVAGGNQVDLLSKPIKAAAKDNPMGDIAGEVLETAAETVIPYFGLARKAWKYGKHIVGLSNAAKSTAETTAKEVLQNNLARKVGNKLSQLKGPSKGSIQGATAGGVFTANNYFNNVPGETPEQQYKFVKNLVNDLSENPEKLADSMAQDFGDLPQEAPELYMSIAAQASRAVSFLREKMPPSFGFSMLYPDGPPPSRSDIMELGLYWRGATNPKAVMKGIGNGTAMPEEVEAMRFVSPASFDEFRDSLVIQIHQKAQSGEALGAFRISQLETLLGVPGSLDPTFSDSVAQIYQTAEAIKSEQKRADYVPQPKAGSRIQNPGYTLG